MKVSEVMHHNVITVTPDAPVSEVLRVLFSLGLSGVPVVEGKKMLGMVTQHDILSRLYPSMKEFMEEGSKARNFEEMEKNLLSLMTMSVKNIMNKRVTVITDDSPLLKAQSLMLVHDFSHLPVVDDKRNIVGMISQGDIFRQLLKNEIPRLEQERYATFVADYYDSMVDWDKRLRHEMPSLSALFKKHSVDSLIDLGCWTGQYSIELAKRGIDVLALDSNPAMIKISQNKKSKLAQKDRAHIDFKLVDYDNIGEIVKKQYDGAGSLGNALPYIYTPLKKLVKQIHAVIRPGGIIFLQVLNFEKTLAKNDRLMSFNIVPSNSSGGRQKEHVFLEFFDVKDKKTLNHNVIIFESDGTYWTYKGLTTIPVNLIHKEDLESALSQAGFKKIKISGHTGQIQGEYGQLSFDDPFDKQNHDWLNVIATR